MRPKLLLAGTIFLSALCSHAMAAEEKALDHVLASNTIRCGYFSWPPFIAKDPNTGKLSDINYEIMEAIGKNLNFKIDWVAEVGAGDVATALNTDKFDVMCASVWPNPGRIRSMTLTIPTFYSIAYAYVRAGDRRFDGNLSKANVANVRVSGIDGDYSQDIAKEMLPNAQQVMLAQTASGSEILMQLAGKKADIVFSEAGLVHEFLQANPDSLRQVSGIGPVRYYGETLAVKRGEYQLKNMLDTSITQLANDGVIDKIVQKYRTKYHVNMLSPAKSFVAMPDAP